MTFLFWKILYTSRNIFLKIYVMKQQVIFISGWNPKENYKDYYDYIDQMKFDPTKKKVVNYNKTLGKYLWDEYEYLRLEMPEKKFADYTAWKMYFQKVIPYLQQDCIIATTSLWSTFILKYLQENNLSVKIKKLFLLAPAIKDSEKEILWSFNFNYDDYSGVKQICKQIYIYHSTDDKSVPFSQFEYIIDFFPTAIKRIFTNKWHFYLEERLMELEEDIKA